MSVYYKAGPSLPLGRAWASYNLGTSAATTTTDTTDVPLTGLVGKINRVTIGGKTAWAFSSTANKVDQDNANAQRCEVGQGNNSRNWTDGTGDRKFRQGDEIWASQWLRIPASFASSSGPGATTFLVLNQWKVDGSGGPAIEFTFFGGCLEVRISTNPTYGDTTSAVERFRSPVVPRDTWLRWTWHIKFHLTAGFCEAYADVDGGAYRLMMNRFNGQTLKNGSGGGAGIVHQRIGRYAGKFAMASDQTVYFGEICVASTRAEAEDGAGFTVAGSGTGGTTPQPTGTPPTAGFTITIPPDTTPVTASVTGQTVQFASTATPAAGKTITAVNYSLDGTTTLNGATSTFPFQFAGTKNITQTVTQSDGLTASTTKQLVVSAAPAGGGTPGVNPEAGRVYFVSDGADGSTSARSVVSRLGGLPDIFVYGGDVYGGGSTPSNRADAAGFSLGYDPVYGPGAPATPGDLRSVTLPLLGNHDWADSGHGGGALHSQAGAFDAYWRSRLGGEHYYTRTYNGWTLIFINTEELGGSPAGIGASQLTWLRQQLNADNGTMKVVFGHRPVYSNGSTHGNQPELAEVLAAMKGRAVLYVSGHDHLYTRFQPDVNGVVQVMAGNGGNGLYSAVANPGGNPAIAFTDNTRYGALRLVFNPNGTLTGAMVAADGSTPDTFTLTGTAPTATGSINIDAQTINEQFDADLGVFSQPVGAGMTVSGGAAHVPAETAPAVGSRGAETSQNIIVAGRRIVFDTTLWPDVVSGAVEFTAAVVVNVTADTRASLRRHKSTIAPGFDNLELRLVQGGTEAQDTIPWPGVARPSLHALSDGRTMSYEESTDGGASYQSRSQKAFSATVDLTTQPVWLSMNRQVIAGSGSLSDWSTASVTGMAASDSTPPVAATGGGTAAPTAAVANAPLGLGQGDLIVVHVSAGDPAARITNLGALPFRDLTAGGVASASHAAWLLAKPYDASIDTADGWTLQFDRATEWAVGTFRVDGADANAGDLGIVGLNASTPPAGTTFQTPSVGNPGPGYPFFVLASADSDNTTANQFAVPAGMTALYQVKELPDAQEVMGAWRANADAVAVPEQATVTHPLTVTPVLMTFFVRPGSEAAVDSAGGAASGPATVPVAQGPPASLAVGALYVEQTTTAPVYAKAVWRGAESGPEVLFDTRQNVVSGTGAERGSVPGPDVPDDAIFVVTDSATTGVPAGLYQNRSGTWVAVAAAGGSTVQTKVQNWRLPGAAAVNATDWFWVPPTDGTILSVRATAQTAPSGQPLIVDLLRNSASIDPGNRATIPRDVQAGGLYVPAGGSFVAGDKLQPRIAQIGVQPAGIPIMAQTVTPATVTNVGSFSVARPGNAVTGNLQLTAIYTTPDTVTVAPPAGAGWTAVNAGGTLYASGTGRLWTFWRIDDGTAGPWTFPVTVTATGAAGTATGGAVRTLLLTNVDTAAPINANAFNFNNSFDTNPNLPALTTTTANCLEVLFIRPSGSVTWNPTFDTLGYTNVFTGTPIMAYYQARDAAGTFAGPTTTASASLTSANGRIAVHGTGAAGTWSPGADVTLSMRYQEA